MKKTYLKTAILLALLMQNILYADNTGIGKIVSRKGNVSKTNLNCDDTNCKDDGLIIYPGDRIVTGKKSSAGLLLNDGTSIQILERSDIIIFSIVSKKNKTLTSLYADYGKFKIIQQNSFLETSFIFKTKTALVKSVCSTMCIITSSNETGLFVYKGEAGFANVDPSVIDAYIVKSGYESFLTNKLPPFNPEEVTVSLRASWLKRYFLTGDLNRIARYNKKGSAVEWFFTEKR
jgi:hypothetical protein